MKVTFQRTEKEKPGYWNDDKMPVKDGDITVFYLEKLPKGGKAAWNVCVVRITKDAPDDLAEVSVLEGLRAMQEKKKLDKYA